MVGLVQTRGIYFRGLGFRVLGGLHWGPESVKPPQAFWAAAGLGPTILELLAGDFDGSRTGLASPKQNANANPQHPPK